MRASDIQSLLPRFGSETCSPDASPDVPHPGRASPFDAAADWMLADAAVRTPVLQAEGRAL